MTLEFQTIDKQAEIISTDTLRPQDLIPAFLDAVRKYAPEHYAAMTVAPFGPIPSYVQDEGDESPWWASDEAADTLWRLQDVLEDHAPEGYYFGAQDGDGACFGFWPHGPEDDDYVVWQSGSGWCWSEVHNRNRYPERMTEHQCCIAIQDDMEVQSYWPNIWLDHGERGEYSLVVIKEI